MCTCTAGFEGAHCEHSQPTCADQPCFHGGKCWEKDNGSSYMCECPRGYTGLNCEKRVDKCTTLPCANGTTLPPACLTSSLNFLLSPHCPLTSLSLVEAELEGKGEQQELMGTRRLLSLLYKHSGQLGPLQSGSVDHRPTSLHFCPGVDTEGISGPVAWRTISRGFSDGDI